MGWTNPWVMGSLIGGVALLAVFCVIETKVEHPMFHIDLFKIRAFSYGNLASLLAGLGRGGLMFILIIWLQGIWLPRHGYSLRVHPAVGGHLHAADDRRASWSPGRSRAGCPTATARAGSPPAGC